MPMPTRTKVALDRKGYFGYLVAAYTTIFACIFVLACCGRRRPPGKRKFATDHFIAGDIIAEAIDNESLDAPA
jgi:hypothetical protein